MDLHPFYQTLRIEPPWIQILMLGKYQITIENKKKVESKVIETRVISD